ncbi:Protein BFR2 [Ophiocordyceps camponoti-floridani]|uniref:Protein BFR2 n=1 Tax=Ophiocordyceps camponoti-floridani TaxID=2030778 RepID=A0A8H4QDH1_9HYPO|nr:Protein BFR2 [Ophiocordyceps camponoti-floridani]
MTLTTHVKKLAEPDEAIVRDDDVESEVPNSDDASDSADDEEAGTEHYVSVGKSRLRQKEGVSLGRDYRGSRVSRLALEEVSEAEHSREHSDNEDAYDDPEMADLAVDEAQAGDSEIDSDEAFVESDSGRFHNFSFRGSSKAEKVKHEATAADYMSLDEEEEQGGAALASSDGEVNEDESDVAAEGLNRSQDSGDESDEDSEVSDDDDDFGNKVVPRPEAGSSNTDRVKGMAIQKQRKVYDGLLNLRIRLQKALIAANSMPTLEEESGSESEPYEAAEEAAVKLLNTMSSLRDNMTSSCHRTGDKRKRTTLSTSMSSEAIWKCLQEEDLQATDFRRERLDKWSRKVQSVSVTATKGLSQKSQTLVEALEEQLANPEGRLMKRTRVARSCAPVQAAKKVMENDDIYDDADFYQLLLKELVDQRTVETWTTRSSGVRSVMMTATREAKMGKQVDRKASKGRKMRFTVHEKLQNLMAPEDRRSWEQAAIDRLFGRLFGRKMALDEESSDEGDEGDQGVEGDSAGLRLFRSEG